MKKIIFFLCLILFVAGCTNSAVQQVENKSSAPVEKSVSELINEVHDLDTQTTVLYNNFDSSSTKFQDSIIAAPGIEQYKTVQQNAVTLKENGKKASDKFNELLIKISEVRKRELSTNQKGYIDKLESATQGYLEVIRINSELTDQQLNLSSYDLHIKLFSDSFNEIIESDNKLALYAQQNNWNASEEELQLMSKYTDDAQKEINILKGQFSFQFLNEYDTFCSLMRSYVTKEQALVTKKKDHKTVNQAEINDAFNDGLNAGSIFEKDQNGLLWAKGEKDELEAYKRQNIYPKNDAMQEEFNKANAYYEDTKLIYEQVIKEESTTPDVPK